MHKFSWIAAISLGLLALPAQAKVIKVEDGAFVTRDTKTVSADPRASWLALITPSEWWDSAHTFSGDSANMTLTPQAGGCFCERIPPKDTSSSVGLEGSVQHMSVILSIPDQALRMRGALGPLQSEPVDGVLTMTLAKADEGTQITFEYAVGGYMRFKVPEIAKAVDSVLSQQLSGLAKALGEVDVPDSEPAKVKEDDQAEKSGETAEDADSKKEDDPKITVDEAFGNLADDK